MTDQVPAGSQTINPVQAPPEPAAVSPEQPAPPAQPAPDSRDEKLSALEKQFQDAQSMIGRQSNEMGQLRQTIESLSQQRSKGQEPDHNEMIAAIAKKMDDGDVNYAEGIKQILELDRTATTQNVLNEVKKATAQQREQTAIAEWHKQNPDFQQLYATGALQPYLDKDPLADPYSAYKELKADQRIQELQAQYATEVEAAKEKGARLAIGAEQAGKVIGKTGSAMQQPAATPHIWKNNQEAQEALLAQLQQIRSQA